MKSLAKEEPLISINDSITNTVPMKKHVLKFVGKRTM